MPDEPYPAPDLDAALGRAFRLHLSEHPDPSPEDDPVRSFVLRAEHAAYAVQDDYDRPAAEAGR